MIPSAKRSIVIFDRPARLKSLSTRNESAGIVTSVVGVVTDSCPMPHCNSATQHYPSGSVVARVFFTANPSVYTAEHESIAHRGGEKEMI